MEAFANGFPCRSARRLPRRRRCDGSCPRRRGRPWRSRIADASAQSGSPRADAFAHEQLVVATGTAGEPSDDLEAVGRMEVRRLEAVRVECELGAVALACDVLGGPHEAA